MSLPSPPLLLLLLKLMLGVGVSVAQHPTTGTTPELGAGTDAAAGADLCCRRQQHFVRIGADSFGEELVIDVGRCRRHCRRSDRVSKSELLQLMDAHRDTDPIELFLSRRQRSCVSPSRCRPVEVRLERHHTSAGVIIHPVIGRCGCRRPPASCQRLRRIVTVYPDTPHQRRLDVGLCAGPCQNSGDSCRPLKNRTVPIDSPNGSEIISVIEDCICTSGCYRMARMEHVFDFTNSSKPQIKEVDVGQCVGTCTRKQQRRDCVYRDPVTAECLMFLLYQARGCVASANREHYYSAQDGRNKALVSVSECSCH